MIETDRIIDNLSGLGEIFLRSADPGVRNSLSEAADMAYLHNAWFLPRFTQYAFDAWADALQKEKAERWIHGWFPGKREHNRIATVGIIMAGNIPMVGLHDLLCILASGHRARIKLSASDDQLIPAVLEAICKMDPGIQDRIILENSTLKNFDAVIATGSNNSSRYFEYYFGKYPNMIRKNRNGIAVITGKETEKELRNLADDIFLYFGVGCRSVSKLYIPEDFHLESILPYFDKYSYFADLHKYRNNYDYQKSILLINRVPHLDNGFLLLKRDASLISPISVVHYETYPDQDTLADHLLSIGDQTQCIVSSEGEKWTAVPFGKSQLPQLWDYADGVDTMQFLLNL